MHYTYRCEYVRCGKKGCKGCPHGPYWYAYWREDGRVRKRYHGKADPRVRKGAHTRGEDIASDPREKMFCKREASLALALQILGWLTVPPKAIAEKHYKELCLANHPDRGGDTLELQYINAAWSYVKAYQRW